MLMVFLSYQEGKRILENKSNCQLYDDDDGDDDVDDGDDNVEVAEAGGHPSAHEAPSDHYYPPTTPQGWRS